jgi:hypothetical protein
MNREVKCRNNPDVLHRFGLNRGWLVLWCVLSLMLFFVPILIVLVANGVGL